MERQEEPALTCPKCEGAMEKVAYEGILADRCQGCCGLWFDNLEHEKLKLLEGSESIDVGKPAVGRKFDKIDRIDCPICHTPMVRMVDPEQRHIHYESCPACSGVFFDAGEFADFKKKDWLDGLRDLVAGRRKY